MKQMTVVDLIEYLQNNVPMETPIEMCNPAKCFACNDLEDILYYKPEIDPHILFGSL